MVLIIAKNTVKPEKIEDFLEITKPLIEGSNAEAGCIEYNLYRDRENSNIMTFVEKWKDTDAIKAHQNAPHYVEIVPELQPLLEGSEVTFHDPA